ncbi:MAG: type 2 lanthipeptide synthetase LanM [Legionellaceae bacterium]|nr:type 2 lanthipeptide synthetase LanM [Legionellaceae bacterium]
MEIGSLYNSESSQLKRWQPLVHHKKADVRFLSILLPILEHIFEKLRHSIHNMPNLSTKFSDAQLASHLRSDAIQIFLPMITKCCVIEMHKQRITGALSGETSKERFDDFIKKCLLESMYQQLWSTYPVLEKCVATKASHYELAMLEFFTRLNEDLPAIEALLLQHPITRITKIKASGDTHRKSRRVLIVSVQSTDGTPFNFVYKPRSLSNEKYFGELCKWYNQIQSSRPIKNPRLIIHKTYGYCEFINYDTCQKESDINDFYRSLGEITALLLLINGIDIHQENIIANGKNPVLIDMECIMTPVLVANEHNYPNVGQSFILPKKTNITKKSKGIDISALSDNNNQKFFRKIPCWHKPGTDEMYLVKEEKEFKTQGNTPRIKNKRAKPIYSYQNEFTLGFKEAYEILLANRDYLLSMQSPLFQEEPIITRSLFRSTSEYAMVLNESYHPLLLSDATEYAKHINELNDILVYRPYYKNIIKAEISDVLNGDIPYFEARSNEKSVYDSKRNLVPVDIVLSGEEQCMRMLKALSENDLKTQCQLIEFSFTAYKWNKKNINRIQNKSLPNADQPANNQDILKCLFDRATVSEDFISWSQLSFDEHQSWVGDLLGLSFYNGTMGIAFMLSYWDRFYSCNKCKNMTEKILESCYKILLNHPSIGLGLNGNAGLLYAAHHINQCGYPLAGDITKLLIKNSAIIPSHHDEIYDVLGGISHEITTLLHFSKDYDIDECIIHDKMDYLKDKCPNPATFGHDEDSHFPSGEPHPPILSYAHGIAGAAIAFSRYAKFFNDDFSKQWVLQTADLLDYYFDKSQGFWPDMRMAHNVDSLSELRAQPPAWCGGHIGIGLFYLECYEQWPELKERAFERLNNCIDISMSIANKKSMLPNLCCGFYGDLDFLHELSRRLPKVALNPTQDIIQRLTAKLDARQFEPNFISLFRGIPSYLYCQLRAHQPQEMPSAIFW